MQTSESLLKEVRRVPGDANDTNSFRIFDHTTGVISFRDNNDYIIVTITDKYVTNIL